MVFAEVKLDEATSKVASACMDSGWMVAQQTSNQVVCEIPMGIMQSAMTQVLIGNSYSTPPKQFVRLSFAQTGDNTRVQSQVWVETQMPFGQVRQQQITGPEMNNSMMGFLGRAGAQPPVGTTYPNYAYLGIDINQAARVINKRSAIVFEATKIAPNSPAEQGGMLVGDVILKVNGKSFKDQADYFRMMHRLTIGTNFELQIERAGFEHTLVLMAQTRPPVRDLTLPSNQTPQALPSPLKDQP